jgi:hypothetical protein
MKMLSIEKFVEAGSTLDVKSLSAMLLRPMRNVLQKFLEETAVDAQMQLTKTPCKLFCDHLVWSSHVLF